jgi:putative tryptophan/tyrosine transport system substrate-binding protein
VELLKETVPSIHRVAYLRNPATPETTALMTWARAAAVQLGLEFLEFQAERAEDVEAAVAAAVAAHADGLVVATDGVFVSRAATDPVLELPIRYRLPTIYSLVDSYVENGGLMAYSPNVIETHRRGATYVDKILKGTKVADLPVELARSFDFAVNLRTAQALGLTMPPDVAAQVTQWVH